MLIPAFSAPKNQVSDPRDAPTSGGLVIPREGNDMHHDSLLRLNDRPTARTRDVDCTSEDCTQQADPAAPVPLCGRCLRLAFAYVLGLAENASDAMPVAIAPTRPRPGVDSAGWVYFIRKDGLVKIGWTSHRRRRFRELQPDEVLATMPGTLGDERRCHVAFAHLRDHGEWFRPEADLLDFIGGLKAA